MGGAASARRGSRDPELPAPPLAAIASDEPIETDRLSLLLLGEEALAALVEGDVARASALVGVDLPAEWASRNTGVFRYRLSQMRRDPGALPWLLRVALRRADRVLVGHINFHGPPGHNGLGDARAVEVGFATLPAFRRQGYAREATLALIEWARTRGVPRVLASASPANSPSIALLEGIGFARIGAQWDEEDGEELVFELRAP